MIRVVMVAVVCIASLLPGRPASGQETCPVLPEANAVFVNVRVIPMTENLVIEGHAVLVNGHSIVDVWIAPVKCFPGSVKLIDGGGGYLLPAFSDMHIHLRNNPARDFLLYLANGIAIVQNMDAADGGFNHLALRARVEKGELLGPRYLVSGPLTDSSSVASPEDVTALITLHKRRGYDLLKIHGNLPEPLYFLLLEEARKAGIPVDGHAQRMRPLEQTLRMRAVVHMEEFLHLLTSEQFENPAERKKVAEEVAASSVFVSPTLTIFAAIRKYLEDARFEEFRNAPELRFLPPAVIEEWGSESENFYRKRGWTEETIATLMRQEEWLSALTKSFQEAGVPLILGTDSFGLVVPGFSLHAELEKLVEAGLTPYEALQTTTINAGRYLNAAGRIGAIRSGMAADLVLLAKNPLENIANTRTIQGVMVRGRWFGRDEVDCWLAEVKESYSAVQEKE